MMEKFCTLLLITFASALASNATVLFPHFVDIAPSYSEGNLPSLLDAGIESVMYSNDKPTYFPATFEEAVSFFKDTLPADVEVEETVLGNLRLITYTSLNDHSSDTIATSGLLSVIYLLEQPDGTFHSGYYEAEVPLAN